MLTYVHLDAIGVSVREDKTAAAEPVANLFLRRRRDRQQPPRVQLCEGRHGIAYSVGHPANQRDDGVARRSRIPIVHRALRTEDRGVRHPLLRHRPGGSPPHKTKLGLTVNFTPIGWRSDRSFGLLSTT